jgi:hypothetical protein
MRTTGRDLSLPGGGGDHHRTCAPETMGNAAAVRGSVSKLMKGVVHLQIGSFMLVYQVRGIA